MVKCGKPAFDIFMAPKVTVPFPMVAVGAAGLPPRSCGSSRLGASSSGPYDPARPISTQGVAGAEDGLGRVLADCRSEGSELGTRLVEWQHFYNWERPYDSLGGLAPIDRLCQLIHQAPTGEEIAAAYDPQSAFILQRQSWPTSPPCRK